MNDGACVHILTSHHQTNVLFMQLVTISSCVSTSPVLYSVLAVNLSFLLLAGEYSGSDCASCSGLCVHMCVFCFVVHPFAVTLVPCI